MSKTRFRDAEDDSSNDTLGVNLVDPTARNFGVPGARASTLYETELESHLQSNANSSRQAAAATTARPNIPMAAPILSPASPASAPGPVTTTSSTVQPPTRATATGNVPSLIRGDDEVVYDTDRGEGAGHQDGDDDVVDRTRAPLSAPGSSNVNESLRHRFRLTIATPILELVQNQHVGELYQLENPTELLDFKEFKKRYIPSSLTDAAKDRQHLGVKGIAIALCVGSFALELLYAYYTYVYGVKGMNSLISTVGGLFGSPAAAWPQAIVKGLVGTGSLLDLGFNWLLFDPVEEVETWANKFAEGILPNLKKFFQSQASINGILTVTLSIFAGELIQFPVGAWFDVLSLQTKFEKWGTIAKWIANAIVVLLGSSYYVMAFHDMIMDGMGWYTGMPKNQLNPEEASLIKMFRTGHKSSALNIALLQYVQLVMRSVTFGWGAGQAVPQFGLPASFKNPVTIGVFISALLGWGTARNRRSYNFIQGEKGKRGSLASNAKRAERYETLKRGRTSGQAAAAETFMAINPVSLAVMILAAWVSSFVTRQYYVPDEQRNDMGSGGVVLLNIVLPLLTWALAAFAAHMTISRPSLIEKKLNELLVKENDWTDLYVFSTKYSSAHKFSEKTFGGLTESKGTYVLFEENREDKPPGVYLFYYDKETGLSVRLEISDEKMESLRHKLGEALLPREQNVERDILKLDESLPQYHHEQLTDTVLDIITQHTGGITREDLKLGIRREAQAARPQPTTLVAAEAQQVPAAAGGRDLRWWVATIIVCASQGTRAILGIVPSMALLPSRLSPMDRIIFAIDAGVYSFENGRVNFIPMVQKSFGQWKDRFVNIATGIAGCCGFFSSTRGRGQGTNFRRIAPAATENDALLGGQQRPVAAGQRTGGDNFPRDGVGGPARTQGSLNSIETGTRRMERRK